MVPLLIEKYVDDHLKKVDLGSMEQVVRINRRKAHEFAEAKKVDNYCKHTVFGQIVD